MSALEARVATSLEARLLAEVERLQLALRELGEARDWHTVDAPELFYGDTFQLTVGPDRTQADPPGAHEAKPARLTLMFRWDTP